MIRTKQLKMVDGKPRTVWGWEDRDFKVGDRIHFSCNGKGRGGHYAVTGVVNKVNTKTLKVTEAERSYKPGTLWSLNKRPYEFSGIYVELPGEL